MNINNNKKLALVGAHGTGKSKICKKIKSKLYDDFFAKERLKIHKDNTYGPTEIHYGFKKSFASIPEQFREVVEDIPNFTKQTEEITLATFYKQGYLENLYTAQGKNILCDRSVFDTFVYYFNKQNPNQLTTAVALCSMQAIKYTINTYSKIYLIEPSDRAIENDGFRMTDKKQQLEIHKLFIEYFKDFDNVEIINQEDAHKEEFINKVTSEFVL